MSKFRKRVRRGSDRRRFTKTAKRVNRKNFIMNPMRGGHKL